MQRIDHPFVRPYIKADGAAVPDLKHQPSHYLRTNVWVSTSGNYLPAAFNCTREALGWRRSCWAPTIRTSSCTSAWTSSPGCR